MARLLVLYLFSLEKREKKKENLADIQEEHVTNITKGIINKVRKWLISHLLGLHTGLYGTQIYREKE